MFRPEVHQQPAIVPTRQRSRRHLHESWFYPSGSNRWQQDVKADGTASQSGTTVVGVGTTFTPAMIGGTLSWRGTNLGTTRMITGFNTPTSIEVDASETIGVAEAYDIQYNQSVVYTTGTAAQSGTTVIGTGTAWVNAMANTGWIIYKGANANTHFKIKSVTGTGSLIVSGSATVTPAEAYEIYYVLGDKQGIYHALSSKYGWREHGRPDMPTGHHKRRVQAFTQANHPASFRLPVRVPSVDFLEADWVDTSTADTADWTDN